MRLEDWLVERKEATYLLTMKGDSMKGRRHPRRRRCCGRAGFSPALGRGNWCLGSAFYLDDLCFIESEPAAFRP